MNSSHCQWHWASTTILPVMNNQIKNTTRIYVWKVVTDSCQASKRFIFTVQITRSEFTPAPIASVHLVTACSLHSTHSSESPGERHGCWINHQLNTWNPSHVAVGHNDCSLQGVTINSYWLSPSMVFVWCSWTGMGRSSWPMWSDARAQVASKSFPNLTVRNM